MMLKTAFRLCDTRGAYISRSQPTREAGGGIKPRVSPRTRASSLANALKTREAGDGIERLGTVKQVKRASGGQDRADIGTIWQDLRYRLRMMMKASSLSTSLRRSSEGSRYQGI